MDKMFDVAPITYVGNNKYYKELSKEEIEQLKQNNVKIEALPASDEVEESSASVVGPMLPQVGLTTTSEVPSLDNMLADANDDVDTILKEDNDNEPNDSDDELLQESLSDEINGDDTFFESAGFIENLKKKFKRDKTQNVNYKKIMKTAKAYTNMRLAVSRVKLTVTKDAKVKSEPVYKELQKKAIIAEKEYRALRKELTSDEVERLDQYITGFDSTFNKKLNKYVSEIKAAKKVKINQENKVIKESTIVESVDMDVITEKNIDEGMKSVLDVLHRKGYKTKASSSGHQNVIIKKDTDRDNVYRDHHYGDARLVFDGKYNLGKAPKYWYWKKVENGDEVDYLDIMQIHGEECPNTEEKFDNWKRNYMNSLQNWVDSLPDISNEACAKEACAKETVVDIDEDIDTLYESVLGSLEDDLFDI